MQKWEYLVRYIEISPDFKFQTLVGSEIITGNQVWEYINSLGQNGWELVSVVERIGDMPSTVNAGTIAMAITGAPSTYGNQHKPVTLGYFYHFKKEAMPNTQPIKTKS